MHVVLWDTRRKDPQKESAAGLGIGLFSGQGSLRKRLVRHWVRRDSSPVALNFAYLAAILRQLGHHVQYCEDSAPKADVYVFNPALITLDIELNMIRQLKAARPTAKVLVVGSVANAVPHLFDGVEATIVCGEPEQLLTHWDQAVATTEKMIDIGVVGEMDSIPFPDWSPFEYRRFRIRHDFWKFPTAMIRLSRGEKYQSSYCPDISLNQLPRFRGVKSVVNEIRAAKNQFGFRSFKIGDPLFGIDVDHARYFIDRLIDERISTQFSIESRVDLIPDDVLVDMKNAGLSCITLAIKLPSQLSTSKFKFDAADQERFVNRCRQLGIRTVAGMLVGDRNDTPEIFHEALEYSRRLNATYANFSLVTPFPGTDLFDETGQQLDEEDFAKFSVYQPVMEYKNLTREEVSDLHSKCFTKYYFRSRYLKENSRLLWPKLAKFLPAPSPNRAA